MNHERAYVLARKILAEYDPVKDAFAVNLANCYLYLRDKYIMQKNIIRKAVDDNCTCGGAGPKEGCPACNVYHNIFSGDYLNGRKK